MTIRYTDPLDEMAGAYRHAQILFAGVRLDVFGALGDGEAGADELAASLGTDPRGTRILCDALVALTVLEKTPDGLYRNGESALRHLVPDAPESRRALLLHDAELYRKWGRLDETVRTGEPVPRDGVDRAVQRDERAFANAMADVARRTASQTADALGLDGVGTFLDVGGGPGLYAIEFARRNPALRAAVLDRPGTLEVARENVAAGGLTDRVDFLPGDAFEDEFGGPWDLILLSNLVHIYSAEENRALVARCAAALAPGGRVVVKDFLLDDAGRASPPGCAVFAVNMLVNTERGDCYTAPEVAAWMETAGLVPQQPVVLTERSRLAVGRKPGV